MPDMPEDRTAAAVSRERSLVERVREKREAERGRLVDDYDYTGQCEDLILQQAEEIERLERGVETWNRSYKTECERVQQLTAERDALREIIDHRAGTDSCIKYAKDYRTLAAVAREARDLLTNYRDCPAVDKAITRLDEALGEKKG